MFSVVLYGAPNSSTILNPHLGSVHKYLGGGPGGWKILILVYQNFFDHPLFAYRKLFWPPLSTVPKLFWPPLSTVPKLFWSPPPLKSSTGQKECFFRIHTESYRNFNALFEVSWFPSRGVWGGCSPSEAEKKIFPNPKCAIWCIVLAWYLWVERGHTGL